MHHWIVNTHQRDIFFQCKLSDGSLTLVQIGNTYGREWIGQQRNLADNLIFQNPSMKKLDRELPSIIHAFDNLFVIKIQ
jgi:hypothetical protein